MKTILAESEAGRFAAELRALFAALTDVILVLDAEGRYLEIAPTSPGLLYRPVPELIGKTLAEVFPTGQAQFFLDQIRRALTTRQTVNIEYSLTIGGGEVWFEGAVSPMLEDNVVWVARDITQRKRAEEALRESEAKFRSLVERSLTGVYIIQDERFLYVNPRLAEIFGYSVAEIMATASILETVAEPDRRVVAENLGRRVNGGVPNLQYAFHGRRKDGRIIDVEVLGSRTEFGGRPAVIGTLLDVTEREAAAARLRRSAGQLRALAVHLQSVREEERTRLARETHDELGQALTGLKIDLSWLSKQLAKPDAGAQSAVLRERIGDMTAQIEATIQTVRRISTELRPGVLDDLGLVAAIEWQTQEFGKRTGIACALCLPERDFHMDRGHATAVFRIFQELLTNTIRHARAQHLSVSLGLEDGEVMLTVVDDGCGISQAEIASPQSLGLLGVRERAVAVGGAVDIQSPRGQGTTVIVRVPRTGVGSHADARRWGPMRILIADDHAVVRRGLRQILADEFPKAVFGETRNAQETLERVWAEPWDVLVLDITMPGRSGLEVLKDVKQARPNLPVLIMSVHAEDQYAIRVIKAGAAGYITKDSTDAQWTDAVTRIVAGHKYVSQALSEKLVDEVAAQFEKPRHESLSDREFQVFLLIASGKTVKEIGGELSLSVKTISTYRARILEKMGVQTNAELMRYAVYHRLVDQA